MRKTIMPLFAAAATAAALLTACSNTQAPAASGPHEGTATAQSQNGVQVVTLTTGSDYRFHPSTIVVHSGTVKVILKNTEKSGAPHNFSVTKYQNAFIPLTGAGQTSSKTFVAPAPGTYRFVCTIHENLGQVGSLVVTR